MAKMKKKKHLEIEINNMNYIMYERNQFSKDLYIRFVRERERSSHRERKR